MTQPTNTFSSYDAVGNREDLVDSIYDISPTTTPILSRIAKVTATATYHEWQTDSLAAASASNAAIEGDDATADASTATTRLGNYTQISDKVALVSGTQRKNDSAGRGDELEYQIMKRKKELKRDMEAALTANNARVAGNDTTARELAGIPAWINTNTSAGSGGSDPTGDGTDARTDGTQRAFAEADLKTVIAGCWDNGGEPDLISVGSFNKQAMSAFTGNATRTVDASDKRLTTAIDVYVSDFGELAVIPNRFQRSRDALVLETDLWALAELRSFEENPLAKTGDSDKVQILCEYTLEARNEAGNGIVADLTTAP
jgi:hypothetical protein